MRQWVATPVAAELLGVSATTVRAMAVRGELNYEIEIRPTRSRWRISSASVTAWLGDSQPARVEGASPNDSAVAVHRDSLIDEVATLRGVALELRARNSAVAAAEAHQSRANRLLAQVVEEQALANQALREALTAADDALGQFLVREA